MGRGLEFYEDIPIWRTFSFCFVTSSGDSKMPRKPDAPAFEQRPLIQPAIDRTQQRRVRNGRELPTGLADGESLGPWEQQSAGAVYDRDDVARWQDLPCVRTTQDRWQIVTAGTSAVNRGVERNGELQ
jgi:hypothetical protein